MNPPKAPGLPPGEGLALRIFGLATASVVFLLVGGLVLAAAFDPELPGDPLRAIAPPLVGLLLLAEALAAVGAWAIARSWGARPSLLTDRPWFDAALVDTSLRLALAQIDDPVLLLGPKGELRFANPAFSRLVSRDLDQLGPLDLRKLMAGTAAMRAEQDAALESGRPWRGRIACSLPDGGAAICALLLSPLRGPDGADLGMVVLGRDISREERIQTQLQAHTWQARRARRERPLLDQPAIGPDGHEVGNPRRAAVVIARDGDGSHQDVVDTEPVCALADLGAGAQAQGSCVKVASEAPGVDAPRCLAIG